MRPNSYCLAGLVATLFISVLSVHADDADFGALDDPLPPSVTERPGKTGVEVPVESTNRLAEAAPEEVQEELRETVAEEQEVLETLDRDALQTKAEAGERAAQVVLGNDFAEEAALLSFAPAAANDALSDAVRWYSLAASRGFPGAPSLDQAGIHFYPVRIQRETRR